MLISGIILFGRKINFLYDLLKEEPSLNITSSPYLVKDWYTQCKYLSTKGVFQVI